MFQFYPSPRAKLKDLLFLMQEITIKQEPLIVNDYYFTPLQS